MMSTIETQRLAIDGGTPIRTKPLPWETPGALWYGQEETDLVTQVIRAQSPFRYYGADRQHMVDKLEEAYRQRLGRRHALAVASGTAALHVTMNALGIGPGDEVLVPGYLWVSCLSAIVRAGAIPRLVDIDQTFCMDPADLKRKIGKHSKAILLVHMSGVPGHLDQIVSIAREGKLRLIEDCAQANAARFNGKPVGSFGDIAIFSFQANKNMTSGEGGMVVCDDTDLHRRAFSLHCIGYGRDDQGRLVTSDESCQTWGMGARMSELTAAVALAQVNKLDRITQAMRTAKWRIREAIRDLPDIQFRTVRDPAGDSGPFLITIHSSPARCQRFVDAMVAEGIRGPKGSMCCVTMRQWGLHWYFNNLSLARRVAVMPDGYPWTHPANEFARDYAYGPGALPVCDDLSARSALLAIASKLSDDDVRDIIAAFRKVAACL